MTKRPRRAQASVRPAPPAPLSWIHKDESYGWACSSEKDAELFAKDFPRQYAQVPTELFDELSEAEYALALVERKIAEYLNAR